MSMKLPSKLKLSKAAEASVAAVEPIRLCDTFRTVTGPVEIRLPYPPSVNTYWRTTVKGHRAITYTSTEGKNYRKQVIDDWRRLTGGVTFRGRLALRMTIVFPDHKERDMDNLTKALQDSLQHAGAFETDQQIKLLILEQELIQKPGWIDIKLGPKPGIEQQSTLFDTNW